jgi:hypothetical protein
MEKQIEKLMKTLEITREEAIEILNEDKEIDRMTSMSEIDSDISAEHRKIKKECTNVKKGVNAYGKATTREIKPDENKRYIINLLAETLKNGDNIVNVEITNIQKYITFSIGSENFELDLKRKRAKK